MARVNPRTLPVLVALGACHASIAYQDTRTGETRVERTAAPPRALPPTARLDERGRLRFVAPLACATETVTDMATFDVVKVSPNPATLVVGVIATGLGFVGAATGMLSDDGASSPLTYVGAGAIGLGVPLVIGPLVGNRVERNPVGVQAVRRPGASQPCGEQPVVAERATLLWSGLHVEGAVGADGGFAVSPFDFVDALEPRLPALDLAIDLLVAGVIGGAFHTMNAINGANAPRIAAVIAKLISTASSD